jgi:ABC-type lipoprotein release transport system permease subunit
MGLLWSIAWRNLWRQRRRSLITAFAMATGVALCMSMICVTDGMFTDMFEVMVEQRLGHVQVHHPDHPAKGLVFDTLPERASLIERVEAVPGTVAVSPRISGYGLLGGESKSVGGMIQGIDPARDSRVSPLRERVKQGRYLAEAAAHEIIIGQGLAEEIDVALGQSVVVVTQATDGSVGNDLYTVVGIYRTGDVMMDSAGAYIHIDDAEALLWLEDQAHGLTLLTDHAEHVEAYAVAVREAVAAEGIEVQAWFEADPQTAEMMGMRDFTAFFMLGIVFTVAAFGVINTMLMSVYERTRELGVLRALGLRPGKLIVLVMLESFFLAALASSMGLILGGLLDWYLVAHGLDFSSAAPDGFSFEGIMLDPVMMGEVNAFPIVLTVSAVFFVSVLASLWPAWRAARLQPVTAIRAD